MWWVEHLFDFLDDKDVDEMPDHYLFEILLVKNEKWGKDADPRLLEWHKKLIRDETRLRAEWEQAQYNKGGYKGKKGKDGKDFKGGKDYKGGKKDGKSKGDMLRWELDWHIFWGPSGEEEEGKGYTNGKSYSGKKGKEFEKGKGKNKGGKHAQWKAEKEAWEEK